MKIVAEVENYYISLIRSMRAKKPNASITEVRKALEAQDITLSEPYVSDLFKRVDEIVRKNALFENEIEFLAPIIERLSAVREVLWGIILDPKSPRSTKIFAADKIMKADDMLQTAVYNSGLLEKHLGKLKLDANVAGQVEVEHYLKVAVTMEHFGMVTPNQRKAVQDSILKLSEASQQKEAKIIKENTKPEKNAKAKGKKRQPRRIAGKNNKHSGRQKVAG